MREKKELWVLIVFMLIAGFAPIQHIYATESNYMDVDIISETLPSDMQTSSPLYSLPDSAFQLKITNIPQSMSSITIMYGENPQEAIYVETITLEGITELVHPVTDSGSHYRIVFYYGRSFNIPIVVLPSTATIPRQYTLDFAEILSFSPEVLFEEPELVNFQQSDREDVSFDTMFIVFVIVAAFLIVLLVTMLIINYMKNNQKTTPSYNHLNNPTENSIIINATKIKTNRYNNDNAVSFSISEGELIYLTGRSGSGKTVLLKMLAGYDKNTSGKLIFNINGKELTWQNNDKELKSRVGFVPQLDSLYGNLTPYQLLDYYCKCFYGKTSKKKIENCLSALGLFERKDTRIDSLSIGQRKRVSITIELLRGASILILDEPDSSLDLESRKDLHKMLEEIRINNGVTIILSTHFEENIKHSNVESMTIYDDLDAGDSSSKTDKTEKNKIKMHRKLTE